MFVELLSAWHSFWSPALETIAPLVQGMEVTQAIAPIAGAVIASLAPIVLNQLFGDDDAERRANQAAEQQGRLSEAEIREIERATGLTREMTELLIAAMMNPQIPGDFADFSGVLGLPAGSFDVVDFEKIAPGIIQKNLLEQLLGLTTARTSGTATNALAARTSNEALASEQQAQEFGRNLANTILGFVNTSPGGDESTAAPFLQGLAGGVGSPFGILGPNTFTGG